MTWISNNDMIYPKSLLQLFMIHSQISTLSSAEGVCATFPKFSHVLNMTLQCEINYQPHKNWQSHDKCLDNLNTNQD